MKKILFSIIALGGLLTSCDMDLKPEGVIDTTSAINTIEDCEYFRNGFYSNLRSLGCGSWIGNTELQMDQFLGLTSNGARGAYFSNSQITSGYSDITTPYASLYSAINGVLFFLENAEPMLESGSLTPENQLRLKRYIGEAKFARAYYYYWLMDHYCQAYSSDKGDQEGLGLSIVERFNPTGDTSSYPGRSSMNDVLSLIDSDLTAALDALTEYENAGNKENCQPNASYLSTWTVKALKARIALATGDNTTAANLSKDIIEHGPYSLTTGQAYIDMWSIDEGSELLFVPAVPKNEYGSIGSSCQTYNFWWANTATVDYIPAANVLMSYALEDIRYDAFFIDSYPATVEGQSYGVTVFNKFPGNESIINGTDMYKNKPKPFRLSEQYLILAEATAATDITTANGALNDLRRARITGYADGNYSAGQIVQEIRDERAKELIGEGFRMSDLRRWKVGFSRNGDYGDYIPQNILVYAGLQVRYEAGDTRYTWPIPADEMEINPQLAGQQNPGY